MPRSRRSPRTRQMELWQPEELAVTHRRYAEAVRFANVWLVAQFPWKARTMPRASYAG